MGSRGKIGLVILDDEGTMKKYSEKLFRWFGLLVFFFFMTNTGFPMFYRYGNLENKQEYHYLTSRAVEIWGADSRPGNLTAQTYLTEVNNSMKFNPTIPDTVRANETIFQPQILSGELGETRVYKQVVFIIDVSASVTYGYNGIQHPSTPLKPGEIKTKHVLLAELEAASLVLDALSQSQRNKETKLYLVDFSSATHHQPDEFPRIMSTSDDWKRIAANLPEHLPYPSGGSTCLAPAVWAVAEKINQGDTLLVILTDGQASDARDAANSLEALKKKLEESGSKLDIMAIGAGSLAPAGCRLVSAPEPQPVVIEPVVIPSREESANEEMDHKFLSSFHVEEEDPRGKRPRQSVFRTGVETPATRREKALVAAHSHSESQCNVDALWAYANYGTSLQGKAGAYLDYAELKAFLLKALQTTPFSEPVRVGIKNTFPTTPNQIIEYEEDCER